MEETRSWLVTDGDRRVWIEGLVLAAGDLGIPESPGAWVRKQRLRGGLSDGVDIVEVSNGPLAFTVVPTRGMGLWRGEYRGSRLGWSSPVRGPVNPLFVQAEARGGLGWLGGFDECIVRCGLESNGAPGVDVVPNNNGDPAEIRLNLHGRIANLPAHRVAIECLPGSPPEIKVTGVVDEAMLFCPQFRLTSTYATKVGSNAVTIADEIVNLRSTPAEMQLLYHCNFGPPFLEQGARCLVPASETAPRDARAAADLRTWDQYPGPTPGFVEQCFWHVPLGDEAGDSVALLRNAAGDKGVAVRFNVREMPCLSQWKDCGAESDGYVTAFEPATNYPNTRAFERARGRVVTLGPGETYRVRLVLEAHDTAEGVAEVEREIAALQARRPRTLHGQPQARFSP